MFFTSWRIPEIFGGRGIGDSAMRRASTLLRLWLLPSPFSPRGPSDYPDGVLNRFLWQRVHERHTFDFRADHFVPFLIFGGVSEVSFDPLYCYDVLDSGGVLLDFLGLRALERDVSGLDRHLRFERNVTVFLEEFSKVMF